MVRVQDDVSRLDACYGWPITARPVGKHCGAVDAEIEAVVSADEKLACRHDIIPSIAGLRKLTADQIIATMRDLGSLDSEQAASLAGLAPSRASPAGGRPELHTRRQGQRAPSALHGCSGRRRVSSRAQPIYQQLTAAGKPARVAIIAVMRKRIVTANALPAYGSSTLGACTCVTITNTLNLTIFHVRQIHRSHQWQNR
ncbi:transposase [Sphingomonas oligophenolica]|uniref:Transposase IS116/IS110/IS902 C-terminal domain-containing protein n=1 Tax=Sphingomonas oligophenolica TaxID=301154 RepID=A0A502BVH2_9SPHN|nr:hypothetical protein EAH84_15430 [Sphingomonas oligophenolica]